MFEKLIESDSQSADLKARSRYFIVSSLVVGTLFVSALIFSIYAAEIGLGTDEFDLSTMIAPLKAETPPQPEPVREQNSAASQVNMERPMRQAHIDRVSNPTVVPNEISPVPSSVPERPEGSYDIGRFDLDPRETAASGIPGGNTLGSTTAGSSSSSAAAPEPERAPPVTEPPPVPVKPPTPRSKGVVNGMAIDLPKPPYPPTARSIRLTGEVNVQVTIDEEGRVVSAQAVTGHVFFRREAERAAWKARFRPTTLTDKPVKVTGIIVYKFSL
jgi:TonB family protein